MVLSILCFCLFDLQNIVKMFCNFQITVTTLSYQATVAGTSRYIVFLHSRDLNSRETLINTLWSNVSTSKKIPDLLEGLNKIMDIVAYLNGKLLHKHSIGS